MDTFIEPAVAPKKNSEAASCHALADSTGPSSALAKPMLATWTILRLPSRATSMPAIGIKVMDPAALHSRRTPNNPVDKRKFTWAEGIREIQVEKMTP
jgi:hypothetical protein